MPPVNWKHALASVALAIAGVAAFVYAFGRTVRVPVLSNIADVISGK